MTNVPNAVYELGKLQPRE